MKGRILNIVLVLVLVALPTAANAGWGEAQPKALLTTEALSASRIQNVGLLVPFSPNDETPLPVLMNVSDNAEGSVTTWVADSIPEQVASLPNDCTLPPPTLISPVGGGQVNTLVPFFQWSYTGNYYHVQLSTSSNFSTLIFESVWGGFSPSTQPLVTMSFNLQPNTTFYWRIASRCDGGQYGPFSSPASFRTGNITGPFVGPPVMISPADGAVLSSLEVTFSWGNVPGATSWQLRLYTSLTAAQNDDQWHPIQHAGQWTGFWSNSTSWRFSSSGTYYWRIAAGTAAGWGPLSPVRSLTVSGSPTYSISGRITTVNGIGVGGVTIRDNAGRTTVTDTNGYYGLTGLPQGTYAVTPSKIGYTFSPASRTVSLPPPSGNINFIGYDKPPVVFVHGWNGLNDSCDWVEPDGYFERIDNLLHSAGYYVAYADLESSSCYTPPIEENVWRLDNAVQLAKAATNQSQVMLISHSMGGLVARAYVEGNTYDDDVAQLFTFGSPHLGVPAEALRIYLGPAASVGLGVYCILQPAVCDFSTNGMAAFNARHFTRRSGVTYHVVSGDAPLIPREPGAIAMALFMRSIGINSDDGAVGTYSGLGLANVSDTLRTQETHGSGSGPRNYFIWDGSSQATQSYQQCLDPVLVSRTRQSCRTTQEAEVTPTEQSTPTESTPINYGTIMTGQTISHQAMIDMGTALFSAQWTDGTVEMSLINPSGQVIDPVYAAVHPNEVSYASNPGYAIYNFTSAPAGTWQIRLRAIDVPTTGSQTMTFALFESSQTLSAGVDASWYRPGATAVFTVALSPTPQSASVVATVLLADSSSTSLNLSHLGGGQYRGSYSVPATLGYAEVRFRATGVNSSGVAFDQGASQAFQIAPNTVALRGSYSDTPEPRWPGATIYQALNVSVGVNVNTTGSYGLSAELVDAAGNTVAHTNVITDLSSGARTLTLRFDGADIYESQRDGPYRLTNLLLTDHNGATLVVQEAQNVYTTAPYHYRDFRVGDLFLPLILK